MAAAVMIVGSIVTMRSGEKDSMFDSYVIIDHYYCS